MSLAEQMESDVDDVFLNISDHARQILIVPPRSRDTVSVVGVWDVSIQDQTQMERGKEIMLQATFIYSASVIIQTDSSASVDGLLWTCKSPGAELVGMKTSHWTAIQRINSGATGLK